MLTQNFPACGIDFGTSNSTLASFTHGKPELVPLEAGKTNLPSAVFYGHEKPDAFLIGRAAVEAYVDGAPGRLMRALKSILSQSLIHEQTPIFRRKISFASIIAQYLGEVKARAEKHVQRELTQVVMGRPVQFVDNDSAANEFAEKTLHDIARSIGFKDVSFQFEPVAAALEFERHLSTEKLALIADLGGGTADFSTIRLGGLRKNKDRRQDILANTGTRVGGTDFDTYLSMAEFMPRFGYGTQMTRGDLDLPSAPFWDLSTWSRVHNLYEPKFNTLLKAIRYDAQQPKLVDRFIHLVAERRCHSLLMEVEASKIKLSDATSAMADFGWFEKDLRIEASRERFESSTAKHRDKLERMVLDCLKLAGISPAQIDVIFFTGGTSFVPSVRGAITRVVPGAEIVNGDQFGAVGLGLGIEAGNRYG